MRIVMQLWHETLSFHGKNLTSQSILVVACRKTRFHRRDPGDNKSRSVKQMDKPLNQEDFAAMEQQLRNSVEQDRQYWRVNNVKCDAIYTAKSYEEFAHRVAAAHLQPLSKSDYKKKFALGWNQYATKKDQDE